MTEIFYRDDILLDRILKKVENVTTSKLRLKPPTFIKQNRKSIFTNFAEFCDSINRDQKHVKSYLDGFMSATSSITQEGSLYFGTTYDNEQLKNSVESYIKKYLKCSSCGKYDTTLQKTGKITYLVCPRCKLIPIQTF